MCIIMYISTYIHVVIKCTILIHENEQMNYRWTICKLFGLYTLPKLRNCLLHPRPKHNVIASPLPLYHPGGCHALLPSSPAALQCGCSSPSAHSPPWRAGPPESGPAQWGTERGDGGGGGQANQVVWYSTSCYEMPHALLLEMVTCMMCA